MGAINLRHACRALVKTPFVSIVAILSLALGIGANAAIFSVFYQAILRPLPVLAPDELVNLTSPGPKPGSQAASRIGGPDSLFSYPMFRDLERTPARFAGVAAHRGFGANLSWRGHTISGYGLFVSGSYFRVLGLQPARGRLIGDGDDAALGESAVVVLSEEYWRSRFDGANVIGDTLVVNGHPMAIVGVTPRGFNGTAVGAKPQVYVPITMRGPIDRFDAMENRRSYWVYLFARLAPGLSILEAQTAIGPPYRAILNDVEAPLQTGLSSQTLARFKTKEILLEDGRRGQSAVRGIVQPSGEMLLWVTATVLLIACVNIANLLLARSATRATEMAVRLSVGGSRAQLVLQLLTESYVIAAIGAALGIFVARWTIELIKQLVPPEAQVLIEIEVDRGVFVITGVLALATGLVFGLFPALQSTRPDLMTSLRAQAGQPAGSRVAARIRMVLATTQIAASMALLVSAGLFTRSLLNLTRVDLGLQIDNVVTFRLAPGMNGYTPQQSLALFQLVEDAVAAVPGVTGVTASRVALLAGASSGRDVRVQGVDAGPDADRSSRYNVIGTDYFRTLGIPILAGREFTPSDSVGGPKVAIVNEVFARKFQLGREAVGLKMASDGGDVLDTEIVGVVAWLEVRRGEERGAAAVLSPLPPGRPARDEQLLRADLAGSEDAGRHDSADRGKARSEPAGAGAEDAAGPGVGERLHRSRRQHPRGACLRGWRHSWPEIGLYGVLAYMVTQRTREIGVRMALGADRARVRGMILSQVGLMTLVGGFVGLTAALALGRSMRSLLFELEAHDPLALAGAALLLALVALGAGFVPAARASRIDPMRALRYE